MRSDAGGSAPIGLEITRARLLRVHIPNDGPLIGLEPGSRLEGALKLVRPWSLPVGFVLEGRASGGLPRGPT